MAVNTSDITSVYGALSTLATDTLTTFVNTFAMTETTKGQVIAQTMTTLIQTSVQAALDQPLKEAQIAEANAQAGVLNSKKTIDEAQSAKDLEVKEAQRVLIVKQQTTEDKRAILTDRQTTFYNDQLRIKESESLASITLGFAQSGTTLPDGLISAALTAAGAITP